MTKREMAEKAIKICKQNQKLFQDLEISEFNTCYEEARKVLYAIRLQENYGICNITSNMVVSCEESVYVRINEDVYIASMGEKYHRTISWPSDGQQPKDEVMFVLTFPTGAYIFGDSYPTALFTEMWEEIKTYDYKYVDDMNHNIYFPLDKAAPISYAFCDILKKYEKRYRDEASVRRAAELRKELERLESVDHAGKEGRTDDEIRTN